MSKEIDVLEKLQEFLYDAISHGLSKEAAIQHLDDLKHTVQNSHISPDESHKIQEAEGEVQYIEVAIRMKRSDWDKMDDNEFHKKMWKSKDNNDTTVRLCTDCKVLAFGVDGFISSKIN